MLLSVDEGLPRDCAVNCDHIQTVPKGRLGATVTTLSPEKMSNVAAALRFALDLG
ncbi:MAG: type II toxin-antitoxin system PemK/MazF family toxin [Gammaproteobacteria bacterium]|nr:type II toxin-antitoxin system PemK/MazF family toxin [Gammaproteobacteria bacterium]